MSGTNFKIMHYKVQSLRNKINEIEIVAASSDFDVIIISEHWLTHDEMDTLKIYGYKTRAFSARRVFKGGGTCILVKEHIVYDRITQFDDLNQEKQIETYCILLKSCNICIVSLYRSPSGDFGIFLEAIEILLERLEIGKNVVLAGDFNVHFEAKTCEADLLCDVVGTYGFQPMISGATRGEACLDNIFINCSKDDDSGEAVDLNLSDHVGQVVKTKKESINK